MACTPSTIVRGGHVVCAVGVTPASAFQVLRWDATPAVGPSVQGPTNLVVPASSQSTWGGTALVTTSVKATITVTVNGQLKTKSATGQFTVQARAWPDFQLNPNPEILIALDSLHKMVDPPVDKGVLGFFAIPTVDFNGSLTIRADQGPNQGLATLAAPMDPPLPVVYLHPAMFSGPWYDDQNGGVQGSSFRCTQADMARLVELIRGHEYQNAGEGSHMGIAQTQLRTSQLQNALEAIVLPGGDAQIWQQANRKFLGVQLRIDQLQVEFDQSDYPRVFTALGCQLDFNPDPRDG